MKLRLHAGSVRLRLSQSEVTRLGETGKVEDKVVFAPGAELRYSIQSGSAPEVTAQFDNSTIRVLVPGRVAKQWIESDETGIEASSGALKLLIEKDFQCLHRSPESGEDPFPNPLAKGK